MFPNITCLTASSNSASWGDTFPPLPAETSPFGGGEIIPYRQLEHTADIWIEITGTSFENLLEEAGKALFDIVGKSQSQDEVREFEITGSSNEDLLVRWLEELYAESQISGIIFSKFKVEVLGNKLKGKAWGGPGTVKTEIKAVTWGRLKVWKELSSVRAKTLDWKAQVLFDI